jgi:hypothetical protein
MEASKDSRGKEISDAAKIVTETDRKTVLSFDRTNQVPSFQTISMSCKSKLSMLKYRLI